MNAGFIGVCSRAQGRNGAERFFEMSLCAIASKIDNHFADPNPVDAQPGQARTKLCHQFHQFHEFWYPFV
jgi:hypothetical protein